MAPSVLDRLPVMLIGLQLVGLNVKFDFPPTLLIVTLTCWICSGNDQTAALTKGLIDTLASTG